MMARIRYKDSKMCFPTRVKTFIFLQYFSIFNQSTYSMNTGPSSYKIGTPALKSAIFPNTNDLGATGSIMDIDSMQDGLNIFQPSNQMVHESNEIPSSDLTPLGIADASLKSTSPSNINNAGRTRKSLSTNHLVDATRSNNAESNAHKAQQQSRKRNRSPSGSDSNFRFPKKQSLQKFNRYHLLGDKKTPGLAKSSPWSGPLEGSSTQHLFQPHFNFRFPQTQKNQG
ncbi:hypothetical protein CROQUDRAFT_515669 [Cronartium quercuum f. sp. fusiforme G11]|uniref:Uncharacterized protein n=1 Tax=Cronartium quercuum f. sp. fusiforme G11 TaxID=708437 RepID=A0A9P6N5T3_9BASI|nr:hypothetical protein CROQUDRAFT_515669 [Cronartium quercuum f. sp. fusiforme G11]